MEIAALVVTGFPSIKLFEYSFGVLRRQQFTEAVESDFSKGLLQNHFATAIQVLMGQRTKIGDIIEIPTNKGLAYAQYTHKHDVKPKYGALLRVVDEICDERPKNFSGSLEKPPRFSAFFPLGAAVARGIFKIVAHEPIPSHLQTFPIFRSHIDTHANLDSINWWLWDGQRQWRVDRLNSSERHYPYLQVLNDTALINFIEKGYRDGDKRFG